MNVVDVEVKTSDEASGAVGDRFVELESVHELERDVVIEQAVLAHDDMYDYERKGQDVEVEMAGIKECDRWPKEIPNRMTTLEERNLKRDRTE